VSAPVRHQRRNRAALLALADRLVCLLSDALVGQLAATTTERRLLISAGQQRHILERRQLVRHVDADLAATRIEEALKAPRYLVVPQRLANVWEIVGHVASADRLVLVALELVPAARSKSKNDEWWVRTAIPFGTGKSKQYRGGGRLQPLNRAELKRDAPDGNS